MSGRIGVLGNCDTGGITAATRRLIGTDAVTPIKVPSAGQSAADWARDLSQAVDVLLINRTIYQSYKASLDALEIETLVYPLIFFSAFHPDCCYLGRKLDRKPIMPPYHSAICIGSYLRGLSVAQTIRLFNADMFERLGYFNEWTDSVALLQRGFDACNYDFKRFYLSVKRKGCFMHSINHPKAFALVAVARLTVEKLGLRATSEDFDIPDGLADANWPIYPDIGEAFGIVSDYRFPSYFATGGYASETLGLEAFVERSFAAYRGCGLKEDEIFFGTAKVRQNLETAFAEGRA